MISYTKPFTGPDGARLVVITLVTSQIGPSSGKLLEVAAVAVDRALPACVTDTFSATIQHDAEALMAELDAKMLDVFTSNGLLDALIDGNGSSLAEVDALLAKWLDRIGATGERTTPLISHGAEWTESWLTLYLPLTLARLGRDRLDVGAMLRAVDVPRKRGNGRALSEAAEAAKQFGCLLPGVSAIEAMRKAARSA